MLCSKITKFEGSAVVSLTATQTRSNFTQHTDTATLSFVYDYATSDDSSLAGNKSDMFLTPALNVKFSKSALIAFSASTCGATSQEIVTWSLDSDSNVPVSHLYLFCLLISDHVH